MIKAIELPLLHDVFYNSGQRCGTIRVTDIGHVVVVFPNPLTIQQHFLDDVLSVLWENQSAFGLLRLVNQLLLTRMIIRVLQSIWETSMLIALEIYKICIKNRKTTTHIACGGVP